MLPTKFRFIWQSGFRREDLKKSANQKQELPVVAMFVNGSGQNVQSLERTFYRCFLPSFSSFGWGVSEEKIKMWKVNGWQTTDAKSSHCLWQHELKKEMYLPDIASWSFNCKNVLFREWDFSRSCKTETRLHYRAHWSHFCHKGNL
jgi:hypothetical protein